jgi:hypothetical protein
MAASLHPERGRPSRRTDDADQVADAAVFPALMRQRTTPRVAKHLPQPILTPETSDVRESFLDTVGAWR